MKVANQNVRKRRAALATLASAVAFAGLAAPASADRTWSNGSGDGFWTTANNWNPNGLPTSADIAIFTDTGAGTVDLGGTTQPGSGALKGLTFNNPTTGYTIQNGTINLGGTLSQSAGAAVTNTISAQLISTSALNVSSGTLVLANGNNSLGGPVSVAAGATLDVMAPSSNSIGAVSLNGGTMVVRGGTTVTNNALLDSVYYRAPAQSDLNPISNLIAITPSLNRNAAFPITYDNARVGTAGVDTTNGNSGAYSTVALGALKAGQNQDNIETLTTGKLTVTAAGTYTFGTRSDDGSVLYIDANKDGTFDPATEMVVNNNNFQGYTNKTGKITLAAGSYNVAIGYYQGGCCDNNGLEVRYGPGDLTANYNDPGMVVLDPTNPLSGTSFSFSTFNPANLSASNVTVTANSTLDVESLTGSVGNVSFNSGTNLTVMGTVPNSVATLGNLSGTGAATLTTSMPTVAGTLSGFTTFTKAGTSSLTLATDSPSFNGAIVVSAGSLLAGSVNALGSTTGNTTVQSGGQLSIRTDNIAEPVALNGTGTAGNGALESGVDGSAHTFAGPITLASDSFIVSSTAAQALTLTGGVATGTFQARFGGAGDIVVNTAPVTGAGGLRKTEGGTLTLNVASTYTGTTQVDAGTLAFTAPLSGSSAINLTAGAINAGAAVKSGAAVAVTGGTYNANAAGSLNGNNVVSGSGVLHVTTAVGAGGSINVNAGGLLQFDAASTALTTPTNNVNVNGGTVHARTGVANLSTQNIVVSPQTLTAGLYETQLAGSFNEAAFTPSTTLVQGTPKAQTNDTNAFPNNTTFAYTGKFTVPNNNGNGTGTVAFGESFDDNVLVKIDGAQVLRDTTWNATTQKTITLPAGIHDVELRFGQGGGGVGPVADNTNHWGPGTGNNGLGFGVYYPQSSPSDPGLNGLQYVDPATLGSAFAIQNGGGTVQVDAGAELQARTVTGATTANLAGTLTLTAGTAGAPLASSITAVNANAGAATVNIGANHTLTAASLALAAGPLAPTTFTKTGAGTFAVSGNTGVTLNNSRIVANGGVTDMSSTVVTAAPRAAQAGLQGLLYVDTQLNPNGSSANVNTLLSSLPTNAQVLTSANGPNAGLDFRNDGDFQNFFNQPLVNTNGNHNYTAAFVGNYTAQVSGSHTFAIQQNDDNTAIYVDTNGDGVFQDSEQVVGRGCCNGITNGVAASTPGNVTLTAGQSYKIAIVNEDTGGGSALGAAFQEPAGGAVSGLSIIAPGATGQNQFTYSTGGGAVQVDPGATLLVAGTSGPVDATINGTLTYTAQSAASTSNLNNVSVAASQTGTLNVLSNQNVTVTGALALTGNLVKTGAGRLAINVVGTGTGSVTVQGGVLGGNGSIAGPAMVASGGTIAPGNSVGTLGTGNFSITGTGGTVAIELDPTNSQGNGTADNLNVTGAVTLTGGNLAVTLLSLPTAAGQQFQIITNDGTDAVTGAFTTVNGSPVVGNSFSIGGDKFSINYAGGTGNDVVITTNAIPEPASLGLLGVAALGLLARRRRAVK